MPDFEPTQLTDPVESVAIYVCTYERNQPLSVMLDSLVKAADEVQPRVEVAVVVVDDNPDGRARSVVDSFEHHFIRGLHYRHSGARNISIARNTGLEAAMELGDWVGMVDDDQVATSGWLQHLIETQQATGADAVTGPVPLRYGPQAPSWLGDQPFADILEAEILADQTPVEICSTGNSILRTTFLEQHPEIRFRPELGRVGGEDMVFYRAATEAGLKAFYSAQAICYAVQPPQRSTYRYQVRTCYWMGNTEFITNYQSGEAGRLRLTLRGIRHCVEASARPLVRLVRGESPQLRFAGAAFGRGVGTLVGAIGVRVPHK